MAGHLKAAAGAQEREQQNSGDKAQTDPESRAREANGEFIEREDDGKMDNHDELNTNTEKDPYKPQPISIHNGDLSLQIIKWMCYIDYLERTDQYEYIEYDNDIVSKDLHKTVFKEYKGWTESKFGDSDWGKYGIVDFSIMRPVKEMLYPIRGVTYNDRRRKIQIESTDISSQPGGTYYIWIKFSNQKTYNIIKKYIANYKPK